MQYAEIETVLNMRLKASILRHLKKKIQGGIWPTDKTLVHLAHKVTAADFYPWEHEAPLNRGRGVT